MSSQRWSVPTSYVSLTLGSIQLFYSQRLGIYSDITPPIFNKVVMVPFIMIQNLGILAAWVFFSLVFKGYVFILGALAILADYVVLETALFGWDMSEKVFDGKVAEVSEENRVRDPARLFWTSVLTSWIAPCSVWMNSTNTYFQKNQIKERLRYKGFNWRKRLQGTASRIPLIGKLIKFPEDQEDNLRLSFQGRRPLFLIISSTTMISVQAFIMILLTIHSLMSPDTNILRGIALADCNITTTDNFTGSINLTQNDDFYICHGDDQCPFSTVVCSDHNHESKLYGTVLPIIFGLLLLSLVSSYGLHRLSDYNTMFRWFKIVHPTLIYDLLQAKLQYLIDNNWQIGPIVASDERYEKLSAHLRHLIVKGGKSVLKKPLPVTGKTCLYASCKTGMLEDAIRMLESEANPRLAAKSGWSVSKVVNYAEQFHTPKGSGIIYAESKSNWTGSVFTCQLQKSLGGIEHSIGCITDNDSRTKYEFKLKTAEETAQSIWIMQQILDQLSKMRKLEYEFKSSVGILFLACAKDALIYGNFATSVQEVDEEFGSMVSQSIFRVPPLHYAIEKQNSWLTLVLSRVLGLKPQAVDSEGRSPLELVLRSPDFVQNRNDFSWFSLKHGADRFAVTDEDFQNILQLMTSLNGAPKDELPDLSNTCSYFAKKGDSESLRVLLSRGRSSRDSENLSATHHAAKANFPDCLKLLLDHGAKADFKDLENKTPMHYSLEVFFSIIIQRLWGLYIFNL